MARFRLRIVNHQRDGISNFVNACSSLRFASMLAFCFAIFLTAAIAVRAVEEGSCEMPLWPDTGVHGKSRICPYFNGQERVKRRPKLTVSILTATRLLLFTGILYALPIFSFSFVCHMNVLPGKFRALLSPM